MGRKIAVSDRAVALAALEEIAAIYDAAGLDGDGVGFPQFLLDCASKVQFRPSTRQMVLTFDLTTGGQEAGTDG